MPTGLVFGPDCAPPTKSKRMKAAKRKVWYWSEAEKKRKVWTKSASEKRRKAELSERKRKAELPESKKERENMLWRRAQRRNEKKERKAEKEEEAKKDMKRQHRAKQVDATILKLLRRTLKSKKVAPKSLDENVKEVASTPKWRHGMREERHERAQLRKKSPDAKNLGKAAGSGEVVISSERKQFLKEEKVKNLGKAAGSGDVISSEQKQLLKEEKVKVVDVGPDFGCKIDEGHCSSSGEGAEELVYPLPIQAPLDHMPPCMDLYQVRNEHTSTESTQIQGGFFTG